MSVTSNTGVNIAVSNSNTGILFKVHSLAIQLMTQHGLIQTGWRFEFARSANRYGCCYYGRKLITVSYKIAGINPIEETRNTILHEIAHALSPRNSGHGWEWKIKCIQIGARPERCYNSDVARPKEKYKIVCPNCGVIGLRNRRMAKAICLRCHSLVTWTYNND